MCEFSSLDRLTLTTGQYANATLTITAPANTVSGTDVTLTIEAKSSTGADSNYVVLRLSVVTKVSSYVYLHVVGNNKSIDTTVTVNS